MIGHRLPFPDQGSARLMTEVRSEQAEEGSIKTVDGVMLYLYCICGCTIFC